MAKKAKSKKITRKTPAAKAYRPKAKNVQLTGPHAALGPGDIKKVIDVHFHARPRCQGGSHDKSCDGKIQVDFCKVIKFPVTTCVCTHPKIG